MLVNRSVNVPGIGRTSMRLEPVFWEALSEICHREDVMLGDLVKRLSGAQIDEGSRRTSAVRAGVLTYFRTAATEAGHAAAVHGAMDKVLT